MALDRLTKIDGGGISTTSDYRVGIITASKFVGPFDGTGGNFSGVVSATDGVFSGNVTIGGTLTYEDVTNIDSVGIITAQKDIHVGAGVSVVGIVTAATFKGDGDFFDLDVDGHTNLDNVSIAGITTIAQDQELVFGSNADSQLTGRIKQLSGSSPSMQITSRYPRINALDFRIHNISNNQHYAYFWSTEVALFHQGNKKFSTTGGGIDVTGNTVADGLVIDGNSDLNGDLDVDGHTNLDNVSIAGVTTITGSGTALQVGGGTNPHSTKPTVNISPSSGNAMLTLRGESPTLYFDKTGSGHGKILTDGVNFSIYNGAIDNQGTEVVRIAGNGNVSVFKDLDVDGHTNLDNVNIAGVTTFSADVYANEGIFLPDTKALKIGNTEGSPDFTISHDTSNTILDGNTGDIIIRADGDDLKLLAEDDIVLRDNDDSTNFIHCINGGAVKLYYAGTEKFVTGNTVNVNSNHFEITSGQQLRFDNSNNNRTSEILNDGSSGNSVITFKTNGGNRWTIDSSGHFIPDTAGAVNIGSASKEIGHIYLADTKKVYLGSDQDLEVTHDGTNGTIINSTGNFTITNSGSSYSYFDSSYFRVRSNAGGHMIEVNAGGVNQGVRLFHTAGASGGGTLKTTSTGIDVTGEVAATQDFPLVKPVLDFNFAAEKKLDPRFKFSRASMATFIDKKGIVQYAPDNQPRFDHHPTSGVSLGLLLEREQQNYQEYSVLMSQANGKTNITVTDNFAISPDGTQNASKIVNSTSNNTGTTLSWNGSTVANNSYGMWSIWVKSEETSCILQFFTNTYLAGASRMNIELADGTTGGDAVGSNWRWNVEKYPNKWWRVSWGGNGANAAGAMLISVVDSKTAARGATCGSATNKTWFAWGVQEEISTESRIATSYIPTNGYAAVRKADRATMDGDDFDDFFDRFQGTIINEHSNAFQSYGGGGSGWEFNNNQFQTNLVNQTGSGYAASSYPGAFANIMGDRGSNGSGSGSGSDYIQAYGPNNADALNAPANTGNGRFPSNNVADYTRYYKTWTDAMSYDVTPSENILRVATGGATSFVGGNTQSIALGNISKFELGSDATDMAYSDFCGRIKRWVYYDKLLPFSQLANLTSQLPQSYL